MSNVTEVKIQYAAANIKNMRKQLTDLSAMEDDLGKKQIPVTLNIESAKKQIEDLKKQLNDVMNGGSGSGSRGGSGGGGSRGGSRGGGSRGGGKSKLVSDAQIAFDNYKKIRAQIRKLNDGNNSALGADQDRVNTMMKSMASSMGVFNKSLTVNKKGVRDSTMNMKKLSEMIARVTQQQKEVNAVLGRANAEISADKAADKQVQDTEKKNDVLRNLGTTIDNYKKKINDLNKAKIDTTAMSNALSELEKIQGQYTNNNNGNLSNQYDQATAAIKRFNEAAAAASAVLKNQKSTGTSYEQVNKSIESSIRNAEKLNSAIDTFNTKGSYGNKLDPISGNLGSYLQRLGQMRQDLSNNPNLAQDSKFVDELNDLIQKIGEAKSEYAKFVSEVAKSKRSDALAGYIKDIDKLITEIPKGSKASKDLIDRLEGYKSDLQNGGVGKTNKQIKGDIDGYKKQIDGLKKMPDVVRSIGDAFSSAGGKLNGFLVGLIKMQIISSVRQAIREIYTNVKELDTALTQISIVTGASGSQLERFFDKSAEAAQRLGASVKEVLDSVQVFSRLGYNIQDSLNLSESAIVMSNVAAVDMDEATKGMTAIIKAYGLEANDAERVADVLTSVGQSYAISASELFSAFERGGAALNASNTSFEESAALFAAGNASIQNAESLGTAMKTVSARIRGAKMDLIELGETEEDIIGRGLSKYRDELKALTNADGSGGVDIMANAATNEYKNVYQIFMEISKVWGSLDDATRARVSEILGGTRQLSVISSIISNIADAENAYTDALNANGTAQKANEKYLDSIEGKMSQLQSSWQVLSRDFLNSDDTMTAISLLNKLVGALDGTVNKFGSLSTAIAAFDITKLMQAYSTYRSALEKGQKATLSGFMGSIGGFTKGALAVSGVIAIISGIYSAYKKMDEERKNSALSAAEDFREARDAAADYKNEIASLKETMRTGTEEEAYNARSRLLEIQSALIENFGLEARGLNLVGDAAETSAKKIDELTQNAANTAYLDNWHEFDKATDKMQERRVVNDLAFEFDGAGEQYLNEIDRVMERHKGVLEYVSSPAGGHRTIKAVGTVQEIKEAYDDLQKTLLQFRGITEVGYLLDFNETSMRGVEKTIERYKESYEEGMMLRVVYEKDAGLAYREITDAINEYYEAVKSGEDAGMSDALGKLFGINLDDLPDDIRLFLQDMIDQFVGENEEFVIGYKIKMDDNVDKDAINEWIDRFRKEANGAIDYELLASDSLDGEQADAYNRLKALADEYGVSVEDLIRSLILFGIVEGNTADESEGLAGSTEVVVKSLSEQAEAIDSLVSKYKTLGSAMAELANGKISGSTFAGIVGELTTADDDGLSYLDRTKKSLTDFFSVENGHLKLNTKAYKEYAAAQINAVLGSKEDGTGLYGKLAYYQGLSYNDGGITTRNIAEVNSQIQLYEALLADATSMTEAFFDNLDSSYSMADAFGEISEKVRSGGISLRELTSYAKDIPELAPYIGAIRDGLIDTDSVLDLIMAKNISNNLSMINDELETNANLSEEDRAALLAQAEAYKNLLENMMSVDKYAAVLNKGISKTDASYEKVRKSIKNLWNSDVFESARDDLVELAKQTGITAADIVDLAKDNDYLAQLMDRSGVSASYLASVFQRLSMTGAGALDSITDRSLKLDKILSEMAPHIEAANKAYQKYESALGSWDYDDSFNNYQEAALGFMENIENGNFGADFYRQMELLTGGATKDWGAIAKMYKEIPKLYGLSMSDSKWEADENNNGYGFLERLYQNWGKAEEAARSAGETFESTMSMGADGYDFNYVTDDIKHFASALGMTEEAVSSALNALSMYGADFANFDYDKLNALLGGDYSHNGVISEGAIRQELELLGQESWYIDLILERLRELNAGGEHGITLVDEGTAAGAGEIAKGISAITNSESGIVSMSGALKELKENYGISGDAASAFLSVVSGWGYKFADDNNNIIPTESVSSFVSDTDTLIQKAQAAQAALNELGGGAYHFDLNFDSTNADELKNSISRVKNALSNMDPDTSAYQHMYDILLALESSLERVEAHANIDIKLNQEGTQYQSLIDDANAYVKALSEGKAEAASLKAVLDTYTDEQFTVEFDMPKEDVLALLEEKGNTTITPTIDTGALLQQINDTLTGIANGTITLTAETEGAVSALDRLKQKIMEVIGVRTITIHIKDYASSVLDAIIAKLKSIKDKTVTVTTSYVDNGTPSTPSAGKKKYDTVNGTAHAHGNWKTKHSVRSLTGELGPELIIPPGADQWYTVGDHGAEFVDIPKGSIVFNHIQTEELLKNGRVHGRGKVRGGRSAFAHGTAMALGGRIPYRNPVTGSGYTSSYSGNSNAASNAIAASNAADEFAEDLDWIEVLINRLERNIEKLSTTAGSAFAAFATRADAMKSQLQDIGEEYSVQIEAAKQYRDAANAISIPEEYKRLIHDGALKLETITDETLNESISRYKELWEKALDAEDAAVQLAEDYYQVYQDRFDLIVSEYDRMIAHIENGQSLIESYIKQSETAGYQVSVQYYNAMIDREESMMEKWATEKRKLEQALASSEITKYSDAWYEMNEQIEELSVNLAEGTISIIEWNNAIRELDWGRFDSEIQRIGNELVAESEFIESLFSNMDQFDENGKITEAGLASRAMIVQRYETYLAESERYAAEIEKINAALADDPTNQTLIDRKYALIDAQRDAIKSANSEAKAMQDFIVKGIEAQISALDELIQKYLDGLDSEKDFYEYQKKIKELSKDISDYQKQLFAYSGDTSEESRKTIQELTEKLSEAEADLQEAQYDQFISDAKKILDDLQTESETVLNRRADDIAFCIADAIDAANANKDDICSIISTKANEFGYNLTESMTDLWFGDGNPFVEYGAKFDASSATIIDILGSIYDTIQQEYGDQHLGMTPEEILQQMKANSDEWGGASSERRILLNEQNKQLAENYNLLTGDNLHFDETLGMWRHGDNSFAAWYDIEKIINDYVSEMKRNSLLYSSGTPEEKRAYAARNEEIARTLGLILGETLTKKDGSWYSGDDLLYNLYGESNGALRAAIVSDMVDQMKENSSAYSSADSAKQAQLAAENERLAKRIAEIWGADVTKRGGSWFINGSPLYDAIFGGGSGGFAINGKSLASDYVELIGRKGYTRSFDMSQYTKNVEDAISSLIRNTNNTYNNEFVTSLVLPGVTSYDEFMSKAKGDPKFEELIQAITLDQLAGKSSLGKMSIKF